jgi:hypothetical protein
MIENFFVGMDPALSENLTFFVGITHTCTCRAFGYPAHNGACGTHGLLIFGHHTEDALRTDLHACLALNTTVSDADLSFLNGYHTKGAHLPAQTAAYTFINV